MAPTELRLAHDRRVLEIAWPDGSCMRLDAGQLRANCRSAPALGARLDHGGAAVATDDLRITGLTLVGNYAVNLVFSDGHDRGIYPWTWLRDLAGGADQGLVSP